MPHIFPRRAYATGEVVDPDALNEDFQEPVGKVGGQLNEHDISTDVKSKLAVADGAYYAAQQRKRASDPGFTRGGGKFFAKIDGHAGDAVANIYDTEAWQGLTDVGGTQDMSVALTTGEDILVMFAQLQHVGWKGSDTDTAAEIGSPLRLQYALRLDGALLDDTITGAAVYPDPPPQQWYRAEPGPGADDFDYRHIQTLTGTTGLSCAVHPARLTRAAQVPAGSHTVEVVARRLPPADYKVDNTQEGATVQAFNRRLFVLRIKGMSAHTGDAPSLAVDAFDDGQVVTAAQVSGAYATLAAQANALENENLARGALRNEHLGSVVYGTAAQPITPSSPTTIFNGAYPGYGTNGAAWTVINDGLGTNLRITGPTAGEWRLDNNPGLFVVLANVELYSIAWNPAASNIQAVAVFALRITNSAGTVTVLGETEVYVNAHNPDPSGGASQHPVQTDVPLMWVVDSTQLSAADKRITRVEVVGSTWDGVAGSVQVDARTQRGMIYGFVLKGVYL